MNNTADTLGYTSGVVGLRRDRGGRLNHSNRDFVASPDLRP